MREDLDYQKMEAIVRKAGEKMKAVSGSDEIVHAKVGNANFCTDMDIEIQKFLIAELSEVLPEASFYGEEETEGSTKEVTTDYVFYLDPIDGTTNYMFGYGHSCVSCGLAFQGKIIAGFIYDPFTDQMYTAVRGKGAFLNGRKLQLSDRSIEDGIVAFDATRYNEGEGELVDRLFENIKIFFRKSLATREGGSASIGLARVASGANTCYIQYVLKPYDYAAAIVIVEEAGGIMTQMDGSPMSLCDNSSVICGNHMAYEEAKKILNR